MHDRCISKLAAELRILRKIVDSISEKTLQSPSPSATPNFVLHEMPLAHSECSYPTVIELDAVIPVADCCILPGACYVAASRDCELSVSHDVSTHWLNPYVAEFVPSITSEDASHKHHRNATTQVSGRCNLDEAVCDVGVYECVHLHRNDSTLVPVIASSSSLPDAGDLQAADALENFSSPFWFLEPDDWRTVRGLSWHHKRLAELAIESLADECSSSDDDETVAKHDDSEADVSGIVADDNDVSVAEVDGAPQYHVLADSQADEYGSSFELVMEEPPYLRGANRGEDGAVGGAPCALPSVYCSALAGYCGGAPSAPPATGGSGAPMASDDVHSVNILHEAPYVAGNEDYDDGDDDDDDAPARRIWNTLSLATRLRFEELENLGSKACVLLLGDVVQNQHVELTLQQLDEGFAGGQRRHLAAETAALVIFRRWTKCRMWLLLRERYQDIVDMLAEDVAALLRDFAAGDR